MEAFPLLTGLESVSNSAIGEVFGMLHVSRHEPRDQIAVVVQLFVEPNPGIVARTFSEYLGYAAGVASLIGSTLTRAEMATSASARPGDGKARQAR